MADAKPFPKLAKLGFVLMIFGGYWVQDSLETQKQIDLDNLDPNATYILKATEKRDGEVISVKETNSTGTELEERFGYAPKLEKLGYGVLVGGLALIVFAFRKDKILKGTKHPTRF